MGMRFVTEDGKGSIDLAAVLRAAAGRTGRRRRVTWERAKGIAKKSARFTEIESGGHKMWLDTQTDTIITSAELIKRSLSIPGPAKYRHLPLTPEEELERTRRIMEFFKPGPSELTVGDLSFSTLAKRRMEAEERRRAAEAKEHLERDRDPRLSVGDISFSTKKRKKSRRRAQASPMTESQRLEAERIKKHDKLAKSRFLMESPSVLDMEMERVREEIAETFRRQAEQRRQRKEKGIRNVF